MFEYFNYGALGVFSFLGVLATLMNINSKKSLIGFYSILLISVGLIFFSAYYEYSTAIENINNFKKNNATLKCISGGGLYTKADPKRAIYSKNLPENVKIKIGRASCRERV